MTLVTVDYVRAAAMIVGYLADRGHRSIALLSGPPTVVTAQEHVRGYRQETARRGLADDMVETRDFTDEAGYHGCRALLERGCRFTAVCAGSDTIAIGAMHALDEAGMAVPDQVSVIGIGDLPQARFSRPALTTVAVPRYLMGARAVDIIAGRSPMETSILEPEIVERRSVARRSG